MTQVHRARIARGVDDGTVCAPGEPISSQFPQRQSLLSRRSELPGDVRVRSDTDPRRRIALPYIREEEQHQQPTALGVDVGAPGQEVRRVRAEADVDVPSGVARVAREWEPDR